MLSWNDMNNDLLQQAEKVNQTIPAEYKDAYFQLVLHPVKACANLYEIYYTVALNKGCLSKKYRATNGMQIK